jgi:hypothetical protein
MALVRVGLDGLVRQATFFTHAPRRFDSVFNFVARLVETGRLPTGVLGIARADGVVDMRAYGRRPATAGTRSRLMPTSPRVYGACTARCRTRCDASESAYYFDLAILFVSLSRCCIGV